MQLLFLFAPYAFVRTGSSNLLDDFRIQLVLGAVQTPQKGFFGVGPFYRNRPLCDHWTMIDLLVDEMDRNAGCFYAGGQRVADRVRAGKRRQQRRVDIDDLSFIPAHETGR